MNAIMEVSAIIPDDKNPIIVLKFISGENPVTELILGSVVPVTFGESVEEEEPEFNRS